MGNNASHEWRGRVVNFTDKLFCAELLIFVQSLFSGEVILMHTRVPSGMMRKQAQQFYHHEQHRSQRAEAFLPNPFLWVPSSYLAMGLIYVTVGSVANVMFKNMGMDNVNAAFWSSILGFPYTFKFALGAVAGTLPDEKVFCRADAVLDRRQRCVRGVCPQTARLDMGGAGLRLLAISGLFGATQDIGSDGVYVTTLPPKEMAKYTGFQSMCWNAGFLLAAGPLIHFSGVLHERTQAGGRRGW